jgi:hypothetical protein
MHAISAAPGDSSATTRASHVRGSAVWCARSTPAGPVQRVRGAKGEPCRCDEMTMAEATGPQMQLRACGQGARCKGGAASKR